MNHQEDDNVQLFTDMVIPDYILMGPDEVVNEAPKCPVLVFINSKSGGQLGTQLLPSCCALLNPNQVFDLSKEEPDKVLDRVLCNLEKRIGEGDNYAANIRSNLKIIVAGGDGTASWLLGIIGDLRLPHPPPIATLPLGTGNNLPYTFGWGRKNPGTDVNSVKNFLQKVTKAKPMNIDSWNVVLKMDDTTNEPLEPIELLHSLHPIKRVCKSDVLHEEGKHIFRGGFWNYFSIGMDAQVSYEFDQKRHQNPEKFKNQFKNQGTYVAIGYKQGWFKVSCFHPTSRNINMLGKIEIAKHKGEWRDLIVPSSIRSIVMLNLPSFSGGLNPWGIPSDKKSTKRGFTAPFVDDGLLDLVGFRDAWHGLTLLSPYGHGTRLAQAHKVRIAFHEGSVDHAYMRMDGEPWQQPLPKGDATTVIEITHQGQAVMLATENCIARTVQHQDGKEHIHTEEGGVGQ